MSGRRTYGSYDDGCAAAHALDVIGERWSMSIIRELLLGPKRFSDLQRDVSGVGPTTLTRRLDSLARSGVLHRAPSKGGTGSHVYELSDWGYQLEEVNAALAAWGARSESLPLDAGMSPDTIVLAMRAHARAHSGAVEAHKVLLRVSDTRSPGSPASTYLASLAPEELSLTRTREADPDGYDATITCTAAALKEVIVAGAPWDRADTFSVDGDRTAVDRLIAATRLSACQAPPVRVH
ncbi:helix-turn-helix transcriptional regulator [Dietzia sp. SLG310A2-38A2]|uniref:winged helix-turn-helix transcriptional regulator n=1 Tax=Dietzia sp. SLG310A2-38A2 TaxID=1630643 RepID=UPI0015FC318C|nr:helix-turn-helix domain-containing protein [Dietzia sp. SLG310A2-38A2]MBB1032652.1 helix-turn-helix transcriptional regulator [Dietzia sp. SLG310A2-38A2]